MADFCRMIDRALKNERKSRSMFAKMRRMPECSVIAGALKEFEDNDDDNISKLMTIKKIECGSGRGAV